MPYRKDDLFSCCCLSYNSIKFVICPSFFYKVFLKDDNTEFAISKSFIYLTSKTISNFHLELIIPDFESVPL